MIVDYLPFFEIGGRNVVVVHINSLCHCGRRGFKVKDAVANQLMGEGKESLVVSMPSSCRVCCVYILVTPLDLFTVIPKDAGRLRGLMQVTWHPANCGRS